MASEGEIENSPTLAGEQKTGITYNSNTQNLIQKEGDYTVTLHCLGQYINFSLPE